MLKIDLKINPADLAQLKKAPGRMRAALMPAMQKCMLAAERSAKLEHLSGPRPGRLDRRSGRLRNSISTSAAMSGDTVRGAIGSNVVYARIHELGGEIRPKTAKALRFSIPGAGWRTVKKVSIPARPFLRPALEDNIDTFRQIFADALRKAFVS